MSKKLPKRLITKIEKFLANRRVDTTGGYAPITKEDINQLYGIIWLLIKTKCTPDMYCCYPIQVELVNLLTHRPWHFMPVPHQTDGIDLDNLNKRLHTISGNVDAAAHDLTSLSTILGHHMNEQKEVKEEETLQQKTPRKKN